MALLAPGHSLRGVLGTGGLSSTPGPTRSVPGAPSVTTTDVRDTAQCPRGQPAVGETLRSGLRLVPEPGLSPGGAARRPQVAGSAWSGPGRLCGSPVTTHALRLFPSGRRRLWPVTFCEQNVLGFDCTSWQSF